LSGDRIGIFNLILSSIIILFCTKKYFVYKVVSLICLVSLIISFLAFSPSVKTRIIDTSLEGIELSEQKFIIGNYTHYSFYTKAYMMFAEKPIFGHGPKIYRKLCNEERFKHDGWNYCSTHPHNTLMQLLAETGVIGTIPYLIILVFFLYKFFRKFVSNLSSKYNYHISDYEICLMTAIILSILPIAPSMNLFGNTISVIYYLPVGIYLSLKTFK